jgi:hypothetical protein
MLDKFFTNRPDTYNADVFASHLKTRHQAVYVTQSLGAKQTTIESALPRQWLAAVVIPVPKIPNPSALCDFRPISVTPMLSRVLEKYMLLAASCVQPFHWT